MIQTIRFVFKRVETILGKGENAGHQHFLLFPKNVFKMLLAYCRENAALCA